MAWVNFYMSAVVDMDDVKEVLGTKWNSGAIKQRIAKAALSATKMYVRVRSGDLKKSGFANTSGRMVFPQDYASIWWDEPVINPGIQHSPGNASAIQSPHTHPNVADAVSDEVVDILNEYL